MANPALNKCRGFRYFNYVKGELQEVPGVSDSSYLKSREAKFIYHVSQCYFVKGKPTESELKTILSILEDSK
jgi:hypothetical protein